VQKHILYFFSKLLTDIKKSDELSNIYPNK